MLNSHVPNIWRSGKLGPEFVIKLEGCPRSYKSFLSRKLVHLAALMNIMDTQHPTCSGWRFILHGGCAENFPDTRRRCEIPERLRAVAKLVSKTLEQGATARQAVVLAVRELEDDPAFNAGHGAALNCNGIHQVSSSERRSS